MGNELDRPSRGDHNLAALLALSNLVDEARVRQEDSGDKEVDHGWDPDDCSDKMTVLQNGRLVERRGSRDALEAVLLQTTDAVRGKKAYKAGTHIWEIHWPVDERGSHAVIGVSVYGSRLQANGFISLVGSNDQSVGWDISRNVLLFNDCIMRKYPEGKNHATFKAPEIITVILNMTTGTISFKAGGEDYGMALSGLRGIGKPLSPTISATRDGCKVRIRYLGDKESATPAPRCIESPTKPTPRPSTPTFTSFNGYSFHSNCGSEIQFASGSKTAGRKRPLQEYKNGVCITAQPLQRGKMFEVQIDKRIAKGGNVGSMEIGVTTNDPNELNILPSMMTNCTLGRTWMLSGLTMVENGEQRAEMEIDMDSLKLGNKVGLMLTVNGNIKFYVNGEPLKLGIKQPPGTLYGVVDVYGVTTQVTIQDAPSHTQSMPTSPLAAEAAAKAPTTRPSSATEALAFHRRCGKNVTLSADNKVAERQRYTESADEGIVFSSRPLKPNERFEVKIERSINKWDGHMKIGIIDPPLEIVSSISSSLNESGKWYWSGSRVCHKGDVIKKLDYNINDLKDGSTVGVVRKQDGTVHFLYNGRDMGIAASNIPAGVHGIVDVYGDSVKVSLQGGETSTSRGALSEQRSAQARTMDDGKLILGKVNATIEMMKSKTRNSIAQVCVAIQTNLDMVYRANKDRNLRQALGDHIADSADIIVEYLKYLKSCGINTSTEIWMAYDSLRNVCWNYTDASLKLATALGQAGLLQLMVDDLKMYKENYSKGEKSFDIVISALAILHNCVKSTELRSQYRSLDVVSVLRPYLPSNNDNTCIMIALLITGYISDGDQRHLVKANVDSLKFIVNHLELALDNSDTHQSDGFHAYEIATGIAHLAAHPDNRKVLLKNDAVKWLTKMMKIGNDYEIECAANAIWCITTHDVAEEVKRTPGLMETIGKLETSDKETISAAVKRIDLRLKSSMMQHIPGVPMKLTCTYREDCKQFFKSLNIGGAYLFPKYDSCYCTDCHSNRGDKLYYSRGMPAKDYGLPIGWCRFSLKLPPKAEDLNADNEWHRAFHGTKKENVCEILKVGELLIPGDVAMGGKKLGEAPGHFDDKRKPEGFDTKQIFVSPSIRYSGHSAYATPSKYEHGEKSYIAKVAFLVLIRPNSYKIGQQTIGESRPIDPKFSNQEIEWSTKERGSTILYGLLVKLEDQGK